MRVASDDDVGAQCEPFLSTGNLPIASAERSFFTPMAQNDEHITELTQMGYGALC